MADDKQEEVVKEAGDEKVEQEKGSDTPKEEEAKTVETAESILKFGDDDKSDEKEEKSDEKDDEKDDGKSFYDEFKLPEGMDIDEGAIGIFTPIMEKHKFSQEVAQELVDTYASMIQAQDIANAKSIEKQRADFKATVIADKDLGGDNYKPNLVHVNRALTAHGSKELIDVLVSVGVDQHPAVFKFLQQVGSNLAEDTLEGGPQAKDTEKSPEDKMFPLTAVK